MEHPDFAYEISDERLIAYSRIPLLDRLRWLDEVRRFTWMVRNAPTVARPGHDESPPRESRS